MYSRCSNRILRSRQYLSSCTQVQLKSKFVSSNSKWSKVTNDQHLLWSKDPELAANQGNQKFPSHKAYFSIPSTISRGKSSRLISLHWIDQRPDNHKTSRSGSLNGAVESLKTYKMRSSWSWLNMIACAKCKTTTSCWRLGSENAKICSTGSIFFKSSKHRSI